MLPIIHCKLVYWKCEEAKLIPQIINSFNDFQDNNMQPKGTVLQSLFKRRRFKSLGLGHVSTGNK